MSPTGCGSVKNTMENENSWKWMFDYHQYSHHQEHIANKEQLIQQATNRLRRRLLQEGAADVLSEITRLQTHLEMLRIEAAHTVDKVTEIGEDNNRCESLDELEQRLEKHRAELAQFKVAPVANGPLTASDSCATAITSSSSFSSSRTLASLFSQPQPRFVSADNHSEATSITNNPSTDPENIQADDQLLRERRRRRVKLHRERYKDRPTREVDDLVSSRHGWSQPASRHQPTSCLRSHEKSANNDVALYNTNETKAHKQSPLFSGAALQRNHTAEMQGMNFSSLFASSDISHPSYQQSKLYHPLSPLGVAFGKTDVPFSRAICVSGFSDDEEQDEKGDYNRQQEEDSSVDWFSDQDFYQQHYTYPPSETDSWLQMHKNLPPPVYIPERNVLDDALSFLDGLSSGEDDGGFSEDMYFLLGRPDLCCRPLSEIKEVMSEHRRMEKKRSWLGKTLESHMRTILYTGWRWCRFIGVLSLAIVVSLLRGPDEFLAEEDEDESDEYEYEYEDEDESIH
ncbi:hypothetical protein EC973_008323 [Apophysomyces ossiformis]|uniref:Uncharacterized protein n=1 Tax=Apophysomyces ossiformis TaxID=679940 RepID=A0A8H7BV82_9FUNG|nr:hypothetical protein EC973_008323 [Apophysomyces ossiformis]